MIRTRTTTCCQLAKQSLVRALNAVYLKLISVGFVHKSSCLYSMSAPAPAFGRVIDRPKEHDPPWLLRFYETDLRIYGVRCLHLFWCAYWPLSYLDASKDGPFMLWLFSDAGVIARMKAKVGVLLAELLLARNWVVCCLFADNFELQYTLFSPKCRPFFFEQCHSM